MNQSQGQRMIANYPSKLPIQLSAVLLSILFSFSHLAYGQSQPEAPPAPDTPPSESQNHQVMTQARMVSIIKNLVDNTEGPDNNLSFIYEGVSIAMVSDNNANRMRLLAPVIGANEMSEQQIIASLVSNFHLALDARYAIGNGVLFSTYIHPLAELTEAQLLSAVRQVASLNKTFGTTYTSGELSFGVPVPEEEHIDI